MGTVPHHQAQARRFLKLARADLNAGDGPRAANALARAASHAVTAAARHWNPTLRPTRRKLTNAFFALAFAGQITHGSVRTFRQIYRLPAVIAAAADSRLTHRMLRRARNRVSALLRSVAQAIAGRGHRIRRQSAATPAVPAPAETAPPDITSVADIRALPNYAAIVADHNLAGIPMAKIPDPHNFYQMGYYPRPCSCHPQTRQTPAAVNAITLAPPWQNALAQTLGVKIPNQLSLLPR